MLKDTVVSSYHDFETTESLEKPPLALVPPGPPKATPEKGPPYALWGLGAMTIIASLRSLSLMCSPEPLRSFRALF